MTRSSDIGNHANLTYIYHYDQLTWMPGLMQRAFYEIKLSYNERPAFLDWVNNNCLGQIYVWAGVITPQLGQQNWGNTITPDEITAFLIFEEAQDESRFCLEFVGTPTGPRVTMHKDGNRAYHSRRLK